jgi:hypothetical protein
MSGANEGGLQPEQEEAAEKAEVTPSTRASEKLEFWKAEYDFQKHLMTLGVAASAGFAALLGGFFRGKGPWAIYIIFGKSAIAQDRGNLLATGTIILARAPTVATLPLHPSDPSTHGAHA